MMEYIFNDYRVLYQMPDNNPEGGVSIFVKASPGRIEFHYCVNNEKYILG